MSTSVTLSTPPAGGLRSTKLITDVANWIFGGPPSSLAKFRIGVFVASKIGASFTAIPMIALLPDTDDEPSLTLVAIVRLPLKFAAGLKVTPAKTVFTSAIAPDAVHNP